MVRNKKRPWNAGQPGKKELMPVARVELPPADELKEHYVYRIVDQQEDKGWPRQGPYTRKSSAQQYAEALNNIEPDNSVRYAVVSKIITGPRAKPADRS